jgi:hypothetical protein
MQLLEAKNIRQENDRILIFREYLLPSFLKNIYSLYSIGLDFELTAKKRLLKSTNSLKQVGAASRSGSIRFDWILSNSEGKANETCKQYKQVGAASLPID